LKTSKIKKISRYSAFVVLAISGLVLISLAGFLAYSTYADYKPAEIETLTITKSTMPDTIPIGRLEFYTWNIGYCGLGKDMDFFYENGKMVRPEKEYYQLCRDGVISQLTAFNKPDFILLQEVDQQSERTYLDDQVVRIKAAFNDYTAFFVLNYKVPFVPVPVSSPMGKVNSGILTLSRYQPIEVTRYKFPSAYSWPKRLFMLDRCFMLTRYNVSNGKQLVVINTHNSAYADAIEMRAKELKLLKDMMEGEYAKGNYVITGGDWNQNPVPFNKDSIKDGNSAKPISPGIPADFLPAGFTWAFDPKFPTNRDVDKPYTKGQTLTTIIDFYVLSPNITMLTTKTIQSNFEFADHQPVGMIVELK
jgi:endonuclease/exonuclease/phosphatase family metal-dependent hydrolase